MKKVFLVGSTGYIGEVFTQQMFKNPEIQCLPVPHWKLYREVSGPEDTKIEREHDYEKLITLLSEFQPDLFINASGYIGKPNVDACEENKEATHEGNVEFPTFLAKCCAQVGIPFAHVSSGCIYGGYKEDGSGYTEEEPPNFDFTNGSYYSGTKVLAENRIKEVCNDYFIWRLRIPFDKFNSGRNYLSKMMTYDKLLDATNSMTHRYEFVDACLNLWLNSEDYGIYNIVNSGSVTTKQVVALIKKHLRLDKDFKFWKNEEEFYGFGAKAPRSNCVLDNSKLIKTGVKMRDTEEAIIESLKYWTELN
tara:strand:- start:1791 stop:2708 length:918 start_codon:yes stop_codon:yes gene_type:complete